MARHYASKKAHKDGHHKDHITEHDREIDRRNLEHGRRSDPHHKMMAAHHMRQEHYAGMDARRRQELEDAGMIHEDHSAIANLPQHVVMKPYPYPQHEMDEGLDDTIRGIDRQMNDYDGGKMKANMYPKKV